MLSAKTIRSKDNLGSIDITINRPDPSLPPTGIYSAHIEGTEGVISEGVVGLWSTFNDIFRIPNCNDICIEYNGTWKKNLDNIYVYYTFGEPYISYIENDGNGFNNHKLKVQQGNGTSLVLAEGNITDIAMIRGWRNLIETEYDQGVIIAYVMDGEVYYRNLTNQEGKLTWNLACKLSLPYNNVKTVRISRTNDYRVIFHGLLETGEHYMSYSERCWAGFAVEGVEINQSIDISNVSIREVGLIQSNVDEHITNDLSITGSSDFITQPHHVKARNITDSVIELKYYTTFKTTNLVELRTNMSITDSGGVSYSIASVGNHSGYSVITTSRFNNSTGDITITYNGLGGLKLLNDVDVEPFSCTFTPTGLIPEVSDPPEVVHIINIDNDGGYYEA